METIGRMDKGVVAFSGLGGRGAEHDGRDARAGVKGKSEERRCAP
jgi:hypothetical protein